MHHKITNCSSDAQVHQLEMLLTKSNRFLFPSKMILTGLQRSRFRMPLPNGGWSDIRDHRLCIQHVT